MFAVQVNHDGSIAWLKACIVAYGVDYSDTLSTIAKLTFVRLFISMMATHHWPLHRLDIKNTCLHGDLHEKVYMEQPPSFIVHGESRWSSSKVYKWFETESSCWIW